MILIVLQAQTLISCFNHLNINQPVHMYAVNECFSPFEGNINPGYPTRLKLYLQATKEIDKETDKIYILVSNANGTTKMIGIYNESN